MLLGIAAGRAPGRHHRPGRAGRARRPGLSTGVQVAGGGADRARAGGEGADVAAAHLAAAGAHHRADRRLGAAGRGAAEDGHLRPGPGRGPGAAGRAARSWRRGSARSASSGILWGGLACLVERDLKRLVAFSSVAHMGFVLLGIASMTPQGLQGALFANIAHGVVTGAAVLRRRRAEGPPPHRRPGRARLRPARPAAAAGLAARARRGRRARAARAGRCSGASCWRSPGPGSRRGPGRHVSRPRPAGPAAGRAGRPRHRARRGLPAAGAARALARARPNQRWRPGAGDGRRRPRTSRSTTAPLVRRRPSRSAWLPRPLLASTAPAVAACCSGCAGRAVTGGGPTPAGGAGRGAGARLARAGPVLAPVVALLLVLLHRRRWSPGGARRPRRALMDAVALAGPARRGGRGGRRCWRPAPRPRGTACVTGPRAACRSAPSSSPT